MMDFTDRPEFVLGDWLVDPGNRTIRRGEEIRRLEPKLFAVLMCLVEGDGEPVTRETIEGFVWPSAVIGQDTLNRSVSKIRMLLEESRDGRTFIETIPKVGYRLVTPVLPPTEAGTRLSRPLRLYAALATIALGAFAFAISATRGRAADDLPILSVLPLTSERGYESTPSMSPDGRFVAYQRYDKQSSNPNWDILVKELDGGADPVVLTTSSENESGAAWSPVGDSVAFISASDTACAIRLASAFSGGSRILTTCDPRLRYQIEWFPRGDALIVARWGDAAPGLYSMAIPDGVLMRLTDVPLTHQSDALPRLSPDGLQLAFVRSRTDGIADIYMLDMRSPEHVTRLTNDHRRIDGLDWTPDGRELLFTSNRGGNSHLWRVAAEGGEPRRVAMTGRNASNISVSRNGTVVYEEYSGDTNIWSLAGGEATPWTTGTRSEWGPRFSPDGSRVVFVSDQTGSLEVWVAERDGGAPRRLTQLGGAALDPPHWLADGATIVYAAAVDESFDLYLIDQATRKTRRLTNSPWDERNPSAFGSDSILFASNETGAWQLWLADTTETMMQLTQHGGFRGEMMDGERVLVAKSDSSGLWSLSLHGLREEKIWDALEVGDEHNWSVWGTEVFYLQVANVELPVLRRLNVATGRISSIAADIMEAPSRAGVVRDPISSAILYSRVDSSESDLWFMMLKID